MLIAAKFLVLLGWKSIITVCRFFSISMHHISNLSQSYSLVVPISECCGDSDMNYKHIIMGLYLAVAKHSLSVIYRLCIC